MAQDLNTRIVVRLEDRTRTGVQSTRKGLDTRGLRKMNGEIVRKTLRNGSGESGPGGSKKREQAVYSGISRGTKARNSLDSLEGCRPRIT